MANAAWLALTVMAHNLGRAVGQLAGPDLDTATVATLRRKVFTTPGRLVHSGRRRLLRLPQNWPWAAAITTALNNINAIPMRCWTRPPAPTTRTSEKPADRQLPHAHNPTSTTHLQPARSLD